MLGIAIIFFVSSTGLVFWLWKLYVLRSKLARRLVVSDEPRIEEQAGLEDLQLVPGDLYVLWDGSKSGLQGI